MNEEIFRKKSLDKIKSPESLDDYICVSNPGVWLLLLSIMVLLIGACVWGFFGHIDSTVPATVCIENGQASCTVSEADLKSVQVGMTVKFADCEALITDIADSCKLSSNCGVGNGYYEGKVVLKSYTPMSFILN